jgi:hypothetical protein
MGPVQIRRVNSLSFFFFFSNKGVGNVTVLPKISIYKQVTGLTQTTLLAQISCSPMVSPPFGTLCDLFTDHNYSSMYISGIKSS